MRARGPNHDELLRAARLALRAHLDTGVSVPVDRWTGRTSVAAGPDGGAAGGRPGSRARLGQVVAFRHSEDRALAAGAAGRGSPAARGVVVAELAKRRRGWEAVEALHVDARRPRGDGRHCAPALPDLAGPVRRLLGPMPADEETRARWALLAVAITDFRGRWSIADAHTALGPAPPGAEQRGERDQVLALVRQVVQALEEPNPPRRLRQQARGLGD